MKKILSTVAKIVGCLLVLGSSAVCVGMIHQSPLLPDNFKWGIIAGILVINIWSLWLIVRKSTLFTNILKSIYIILLNVMLLIGSTILNTPEIFINQLLKKMPNQGVESILIFAQQDDDYNDQALFLGTVAIQTSADQDNQNYAIDYLNLEFSNVLKTTSYVDIFEAVKAFVNQETRFLLVNKSYLDIIEGYPEYSKFRDNYKVVKEVTRIVMYEEIVSDAKVASEPFNIMITGEDTWGEVTNVSRSDVNMIMSINPITKQVLLTSLPRDSYVSVPCWNGEYDKLTHASAASWREPKGIECLKLTLEEHLDIKIDFFIKLNFSSVHKIVDAIGGITVDNPYEFTYYKEPFTKFPKGVINLNGKDALYYVRERKTIQGGDFARNRHQQIVIDAMIKKLVTPSMLLKSKDLLQAIEGAYITNFGEDQIISLIKLQMNDLAKWNVKAQAIQGQGASKFVAIMDKSHVVYVNINYPEHLEAAKENIAKLFAGEIMQDIVMPKGIKRNIPNDVVTPS
jgi:polyisoprenyl-teichoic acid--peptidoglycan teichoic acid transferase